MKSNFWSCANEVMVADKRIIYSRFRSWSCFQCKHGSNETPLDKAFSQLSDSGPRLLYPRHEWRVYFDRTVGSHRDHCDPGRDALAGAGPGETQSSRHRLHEQTIASSLWHG